MFQLLLSQLLVFIALGAQAKLISSSTKNVSVEIQSVTLEVTAKCRVPQFEDDAFTTYFSPESYEEVNPYLNSGYSMKLLNKTCGGSSTETELSYDKFETVTVLFVDGATPLKKLKLAIENIWNSSN